MLKVLPSFAAALAMALCVGTTSAAELKSGPQKGEEVGAYEVVKCAGNANDGVDTGKQLCYRCKLGNRPVVMVFARKPDAKLAGLVKELDKVVAANAEKKLASFVNLIGTDAASGKAAAEKLVADSKAENIAVVIPADQPNGPAAYNIAPEADVTVLIYVKGEVKANHAVAAGGLTDDVVKKIVADTSTILN
ncbi:MAG: hypothetical protein QM811_01015 [Pirellulales bacterium]